MAAKVSWWERSVVIYLATLTLLLPLKFGSITGLPETTAFHPDDLFAYLFITWPPHLFGVFSGIGLFLAGTAFPLQRGTWKMPGGVTALLWAFGLPLAAALGSIRAVPADYATVEILHLAGVGAYALSIWLWLTGRPEGRRVFHTMLSIGALWLIYLGLNQYFFGFAETRRHAEEMAAQGVEVSSVMLAKLSDDRVFASFVSSNMLSGYLVLVVPLAMAAVVRFAGKFEPAKVSRWLLGAPVFIGFAAVLLLARSRATFLAIIITAVLFAFSLPMRRSLRIAFAALALLVVAGGAFYIHRAGRGFSSMEERVDYLRSSGLMMAEKPFLGYGWGGFFTQHMRHKTTTSDESAHDPHNFVLSFATQAGIPAGLLALAAALYPMIVLGRRLFGRNGKRELFKEAVFWGALAFFLHALMDVDLQVPAIMAACSGLLVAELTDGQPEAPPLPKRGFEQIVLVTAIVVLAINTCWKNLDWVRGDILFERLRSFAYPQSVEELRRPVTPDEFQLLFYETIKKRPNSPFTWETAGDFHLRVRQPKEAEKYFRRAAELAPDRPAIHRRLFELELARGNREAAREHLKKMYELFPSNPKNIELVQKHFPELLTTKSEAAR